MGDDMSMAFCFDFCSSNIVQLSNPNPYLYRFWCHHPLMTQLTYFESPKNGLPCTVGDPLGCHFVLYKVGWKLWSWLTSRRESFSTLTLTYMHSITELSHWKKTSSWIEKSDPDQGKSLTSWLFRCQKDQNFLTRSYVSRCSLGSRVSPVNYIKVWGVTVL